MGSIPEEQMTPSSQRSEPGSINLHIAPWPPTAKNLSADADAIATQTVSTFNRAIDEKNHGDIANLFHEDGYWRDHLALSWTLQTLKGKSSIQSLLQAPCPLVKVELDKSTPWRSPQIAPFNGPGDVKGIQFYVLFVNNVGSGRGLVRMAERDGNWKIWTLFTTLTALSGHEEPLGSSRSWGVQHGVNAERKNWLDRTTEESEFSSGGPDVLIIGAGQAGLTVHARLKMLNVPTLIIDKNDSVGDNWRKRYHQLVLHDVVWFDHLPYISFPPSWPVYTPKDKLADWFELYARALELNIWTKSSIESTSWDDAKAAWTVVIKRTLPDGSIQTRTLHPKHIIQSTGHSGKPYMPTAVKGINDGTFKGDVLAHSSAFPGARPSPDNKSRRAVIVGACNSAHDIAQDYVEHGYGSVTLLQRSTTCVMSTDASIEVLFGDLYSEHGPPVEDADLWLWGWPAEVIKAFHREQTVRQHEIDRQMLDSLAEAGFGLDSGPDDCGLFIKYLQRGGGYYLDVGSSQLITEGRIKVVRGQEVAEMLPHGVKLSDGRELEADEVVFATGYESMRSQARAIFGDAVADKVGDVWGFGEDGEIRGLWRPTGHPGFWFHAGNLGLCRYYSKILALQIKARLEGLT